MLERLRRKINNWSDLHSAKKPVGIRAQKQLMNAWFEHRYYIGKEFIYDMNDNKLYLKTKERD